MDTSKTSSIKSLLVKAWRERWSDVMWGINIKQVLPRGVSGDVYNLADCIIQQALIGPGPNHVVLAYVKHCLSSRLVSCGAVLQSINKYNLFHKPHCILCLLDLLKSFLHRISCYGNDDECLSLCTAMVNCVLWLFCCIHQSLQKMTEIKQSTEHSNIIEKACEILKVFFESIFFKSLLFVGKREDEEAYRQVLQKEKDVENQLAQMQGSSVNKDLIEHAIIAFNNVDSVADYAHIVHCPQMLTPSLNGLLTLEAILHPTSDVHALVDQILLLHKLQNIPWPRLFCEMIRSCFMGMIDSAGSNEELKWASFTFLKVPQIIVKINAVISESSSESSKELEKGLELLLGYIPLLDLTDAKCNCDCIQYLLNELYNKTGLLSEEQAKKLVQQRNTEGEKATVRIPELQKSQLGSTDLILRAESTVASILKTLDADYSKNQDALLGVLCHMMSGKSFELIVAAAAATGKLMSFSVKLIKFNEFSKQNTNEGSKASQTRALLFDITFLMLCHIAQQYGSDVVTSNGETKDSFFQQWVIECLSEGGKCKSPDLMLQRADANKVDYLLSQFSSSDGDFKTSSVKWHEVCINASAAVKEVLWAWESGCITTDGAKAILDNVKGRMCSLPVCISAWLCSYISVVHHEHHLKPMSMLQEFQKVSCADPNMADSSGSSIGNVMEGSNQYYKERSGLMVTIIKRMIYDMHPPFVSQAKHKIGPLPHALVSKTPINEILGGVFYNLHSRGWLDLKSTHLFESLLRVGGPVWFCNTLITMGLDFAHKADLQRSVDLLFAIFEIDIELCALAMLVRCLPAILFNDFKMDIFSEPRGSALARLIVMCLFAALQSKQSQKGNAFKKRLSKRSARDLEMEEMADFFSHKNTWLAQCLTSCNDMDDMPAGMGLSGDSMQSSWHEPLHMATVEMFHMFIVIASDPNISQKTQFVLHFLKEAVTCGKENAKKILQFMPMSLVSRLMKCLPELFTTTLLLQLCDVDTAFGRRKTAKLLVQLQNSTAAATSV